MRPLPTEREIIERLKRELGDKIVRLAEAERRLELAEFAADLWRERHQRKCDKHSAEMKARLAKLKAYKAYVKQLTGRDSLPKPIKAPQ